MSMHLDAAIGHTRISDFTAKSAVPPERAVLAGQRSDTTREYAQRDIEDLLADLPQLPGDTSFGADIDEVNRLVLDQDLSSEAKAQHLKRWVSTRFQPCILGRLGAKDHQGIAFDVCWIDRATLLKGSSHVRSVLQAARRDWKQRTKAGATHGLLVMFNAPELAFAQPGPQLLEACRKLSDLYLVEYAPVEPDVIYQEAVPLEHNDGQLALYKATVTLFYTSAHRTRAHDRRVPGGLMMTVVSVGQLANSLVTRGLSENLEQAVKKTQDLALRSIGNGGLGHEGTQSSTWHNLEGPWDSATCPIAHRPRYVPENFSARRYSSAYHTDVLVPTAVTLDGRLDQGREEVEIWPDLRIDYFHVEKIDGAEHDHGVFDPHPIRPEAIYHNPWPPLRAINSPLADY